MGCWNLGILEKGYRGRAVYPTVEFELRDVAVEIPVLRSLRNKARIAPVRMVAFNPVSGVADM